MIQARSYVQAREKNMTDRVHDINLISWFSGKSLKLLPPYARF